MSIWSRGTAHNNQPKKIIKEILMTDIKNTLLLAASLMLTTVCSIDLNSDDDTKAEKTGTDNPDTTPEQPAFTEFKIALLPDTQGGSDAQGQSHVAMHPMSELLKQQSAMNIDMVIALGDLTDGGSEIEFNEWRSVADQYAEQGIEFLPVMGNHETSYAYTVNWIKHMKNVSLQTYK